MAFFAELNMEKYIAKEVKEKCWFIHYDLENGHISLEEYEDRVDAVSKEIREETLDKYIKGDFDDPKDLRGYEE